MRHVSKVEEPNRPTLGARHLSPIAPPIEGAPLTLGMGPTTRLGRLVSSVTTYLWELFVHHSIIGSSHHRGTDGTVVYSGGEGAISWTRYRRTIKSPHGLRELPRGFPLGISR